jgi:hypothetical protein
MRMVFVAVMLVLTGPASGQSSAVQMGKQYLFAWYDHSQQVEMVEMALENIKGKRGIDPMIEDRASRIQRNLSRRLTRIGGRQASWLETYADYTFLDENGRSWHLYKFFLDELMLTGVAVSRWHCRSEDQDMENAERYCERTNAAARELFVQIESKAGSSPF